MRIAALSLTAILAVSVAACSLPGTGASDQPSEPAVPPASVASSAPASATEAPSTATDAPSASASNPASASASASASAQPTPADPNQPGAADELGQVVATRTTAWKGVKVQLQLYPVKRQGATSQLNFTLNSAVSQRDQQSVGFMLADGNSSAIDETVSSADGLQLVDGKNSKLYLVASDGNGQCLCSRDLSTVYVSSNLPVLMSATFAAPPADVTTVDVRIPNFGTVTRVPVQ